MCYLGQPQKNFQQVKWVVIALIICLILFAVLTNNKSAELNFINIVVIWYFATSYIIPYFEKRDMHGSITYLEFNEHNSLLRSVFMIFAVFVCVFNFYLLLK
jgi:uncharacterized membrane protein (DUF441 family)